MRACREGASTRLELTTGGALPPHAGDAASRPLGKRPAGLRRRVPRRHRAATAGEGPQGLRGQRLARAAHAHHRHPRLRGDAPERRTRRTRSMAPKMVDIIHRQSERLSELVEDLLELSRLESREVEAEHRHGRRLARPPASAPRRSGPRRRPRTSQLELHVPAELDGPGDERAVEQVLLNLLDNAVKYTPPAGGWTVTGAPGGGRCVVSVKDTGMGIEPKHLPASSSASTGWTKVAAGTWAAPAWGSPSSSTWSARWRGRSSRSESHAPRPRAACSRLLLPGWPAAARRHPTGVG